MIRFKTTSGSKYEYDDLRERFRCFSDATEGERFVVHEDGTWHPAYLVFPLELGERATFHYTDIDRMRSTSPVVLIEDDEEEATDD